jgi:Zn-dependent metalloprotease
MSVRKQSTSLARAARRAFWTLRLVAAIAGLPVARGQQDADTEKITAQNGTVDGLLVSKRSTWAVQSIVAARVGKGMPSHMPVAASVHERALVEAHAASLGLQDAADVALKRATGRDEVGLEHARYQQVYLAVPVTGGEVLVHLNGDRVVYSERHGTTVSPCVG